MLHLSKEEQNDLLKVVEYSTACRNMADAQQAFNQSESNIVSLSVKDLEKYMSIYENNFEEIEKTFSKEFDEKKLSNKIKNSNEFEEQAIALLSALSTEQLNSFSLRMIGLDYYDTEFDEIQTIKDYISKDIETSSNHISLNKYLSNYYISYDTKVSGKKEDIIRYICDLYPPVSEYESIGEIGSTTLLRVMEDES